MNDRKKEFVAPLLILAFGVGWLLNGLKLLPGVDWAWSIGLAVCGVLVLVVGGITRLSVVFGPFLLVASVLSIARQQYNMRLEIEMPALVIALGGLMTWAAAAEIPPAGSGEQREDE